MNAFADRGRSKELRLMSVKTVRRTMIEMTRELEKLQREFALAQEQYKADSDALNEELLNDFQGRLMPIIESLWLQIGPVQALHTDAGISFGSECHYTIINALRRHDSHAARQAMAEDIDMGISYLRANALFFEV